MKKLNLGCQDSVLKGYVNLDIWEYKGVDVVWDLEKTPLPFEDNTFDEILASNVLEHITNLVELMKELHRITKNKGIIKISVPFYNSPYAICSLDHKHFFEYNSWQNFTNKFYFHGEEKYKFKHIKTRIKPTKIGALIPSDWLLKWVSYYIGNLVSEIHFELRVIKK